MLSLSDDRCPTCPQDWADGRWACSQDADWVDSSGNAPWGEGGPLRYLASANAGECRWLADSAFENLHTGAWRGRVDENGWEGAQPTNEEERRWRIAARDFYDRFTRGERSLTEGLVAYGKWDLGRELAWRRGWCPGEDAAT